MATDRRVGGGHRLERAAAEVAGEDDVNHVLGRERTHGCDRIDDRDRPLDRQLVRDPELLDQLTVQRSDEALARVHAASRKQPVVAIALLVPAEEDAPAPAQDRGDANPRLGHQLPDDPWPRTPRSVTGSSFVSASSSSGTSSTTSCAMRIPGSTTKRSDRSVLSRITLSSPR